MPDNESLRQIVRSRAPLSTWFGIVLLFALFGVIVLAVIGSAPRGSDYEETRAKKRLENLKTSREEAEKALTTYGWIDKDKGVARIPIKQAMELTVAELAQRTPAPAGPIATPEPHTPAAPASPAPAGSPQPGAAPPAASPSGEALGSPSPPQGAAAAPGTSEATGEDGSPLPPQASSPSPASSPAATSPSAPASPAPASPSPASSP